MKASFRRSRRGNETERAVDPSRSASSPRRLRTRGFTLLELLISTAVGAVVLVVIQTTFFGALRLHNTTHERIDEDLALHRALTLIRRDLAGVMLPPGANAVGTLAGPFQTENFSTLEGDSYGERVSPDLFTTTGRVDGYNPFGDVQRVAYYLQAESGGAGSKLVRVTARNLLPVQEIMADEQMLLEGVTAVSLSYYDGAGWMDTWDSTVTSTLPKAIRFSLTLAQKDASQVAPAPIEMVVPVFVVTTTQQREEEEAAAP